MAVQIGSKNHSFSEPTGLLSDCHRRIEMFLRTLESVSSLIDKPLDKQAQTALESALRYFREAAPKHTADEEESLFPRLRQVHRPEVEAAVRTLDALEHDHLHADRLHAEVDRLGQKCRHQGSLSPSDAAGFRTRIAELAVIYKDHIRVEDEVVFPVAGRMLSESDKAQIASEMASRRK